jgi:hypothetical protein
MTGQVYHELKYGAKHGGSFNVNVAGNSSGHYGDAPVAQVIEDRSPKKH